MVKWTVTKLLAYLSPKLIPSFSLEKKSHVWKFFENFYLMVISISKTNAIRNFRLQLCRFDAEIRCQSSALSNFENHKFLFNSFEYASIFIYIIKKKLKILIWFLIFDKAKIWHPISASKQQSCSMTRDTFYHRPRLFPIFPDMSILCKT